VARLPTLQKILPENFPDLKWLPQIAGILNQFMLQVTRSLSNELTISSNFDGEIKTVIVDGSGAISLSWTGSSKPTIGWIGAIRRIDGTDFTLSNAVSLDWEFSSDNKIKIKGHPGLTASSTDKYELKLIFLVG